MKVQFLDLKSQYAPFTSKLEYVFREILNNARFIKEKSVSDLEKVFSDMHSVKHSVAVSSGTSALYASLMALDIGYGDEIITSPFTFVATGNIIKEKGAKPVFVDIDPRSFTINTKLIKDKITEKTKAIIPVHLFGQMADMEPICGLAQEYNLNIIEDAAQSHLASYNNKKSGSVGKIGCFSLYPAKNLGAFGDGGIITTNDDNLANILREKTNNGMPIKGSKHQVQRTGLNFRLNELTAALMLVYIDKIYDWTRSRNENAQLYRENLYNLDEIKLPELIGGNYHVYHQFTIRAQRRDELKDFLKINEIDTCIFYPSSLSLLPAYRDLRHIEGDFPESERASKEVLSLPIGPHLTEQQIKFVSDRIKEFYKN